MLLANHVIFLVFLKSLSSGKYSAVIRYDPSGWIYLVWIWKLPQFINVIFYPTTTSWSASSNSINNSLDFHCGLSPRAGLSLLLATVIASGYLGPLVTMILEAFSTETAEYLGQIGSIILLLIAQIFYHSIKLALLLGPCSNINSIKVSTLIPFLRQPLKVGNLGSFHPSTLPVSTNQVSFLLLKTVC